MYDNIQIFKSEYLQVNNGDAFPSRAWKTAV